MQNVLLCIAKSLKWEYGALKSN